MKIKSIAVAGAMMTMTLVPFSVVLAGKQPAGAIDWSVQTSWNIPVKPRDMVQSLDNKKVFILGDDAKVYIYTPQGKLQGTIPVDAGVMAIDIAPRGEMLYLLDSDKARYTAISVSLVKQIDITGAPFLGNPEAPVTMVVFSDFQ